MRRDDFTRLERWTGYLAVVWIVDFASFIVGTIVLGGDAVNGVAAGGHYYLAAHRSDRTEVSRAVYLYSEWHTWSVWAATFVLMAFLLTLRVRAWRAARALRARRRF